MRDGWEERAAVVGALWTFGAVLPVVVVDAVAVPGRAFGGMGILCGGVLDMCVNIVRKRWPLDVPVEDVEAVDRHGVVFFFCLSAERIEMLGS